MKKEEAIKKANELLNEDVSEDFEEQIERTWNTGMMSFLVSNSGNATVLVKLHYDESADEVGYSIIENWTNHPENGKNRR